MELHFKQYTGTAISEVFEPLAQLRIAVFRDFPYLYEGSLKYEKQYLATYSAAPGAFLFSVFDGEEMVGATTCIPLTDETEEVKRPFIEAGYDLPEICYLGESILLPAYRGLGLGNRFFDERERHAQDTLACRYTAFCAVDRPVDHPLRPAGYRPLDAFWQKRGYRKMDQIATAFSWKDLDEPGESPKKMIFWMKNLP